MSITHLLRLVLRSWPSYFYLHSSLIKTLNQAWLKNFHGGDLLVWTFLFIAYWKLSLNGSHGSHLELSWASFLGCCPYNNKVLNLLFAVCYTHLCLMSSTSHTVGAQVSRRRWTTRSAWRSATPPCTPCPWRATWTWVLTASRSCRARRTSSPPPSCHYPSAIWRRSWTVLVTSYYLTKDSPTPPPTSREFLAGLFRVGQHNFLFLNPWYE